MRNSLRVGLVLLLTALLLAPVGARATNDPFWSQQWALSKMRVVPAWEQARGSGVVVAVVDTGVDLNHPDLRGRLLVGRDFVDGDAKPQDLNGHGTHMAGSIAAGTGNGVGIASVAPESKILPVRVLDAKGQSDDPEAVAEGIRWAVDQRARVLNLSLAQDGPAGVARIADDLLSHSAIDDAIKYATSKGAVVVVAAGNSDGGGKSKTAYTATSPGAIVVGASTNGDRRAAYSNYGTGLDVLAPGGGSPTDPNFDRGCTLANAVVGLYWNPSTKRSDYAGACGTSVAVAHVSGLAALLLQRGYSNAQAVQRIERTAADLGAKGKDAQTGWGRVDAYRALGATPARAGAAPSVAPTRPAGSKGRVEPAAGGVEPARSAPAGTKPRALRKASEPASNDRVWVISIAAVLAMMMGLTHSEVRRRTLGE